MNSATKRLVAILAVASLPLLPVHAHSNDTRWKVVTNEILEQIKYEEDMHAGIESTVSVNGVIRDLNPNELRLVKEYVERDPNRKLSYGRTLLPDTIPYELTAK